MRKVLFVFLFLVFAINAEIDSRFREMIFNCISNSTLSELLYYSGIRPETVINVEGKTTNELLWSEIKVGFGGKPPEIFSRLDLIRDFTEEYDLLIHFIRGGSMGNLDFSFYALSRNGFPARFLGRLPPFGTSEVVPISFKGRKYLLYPSFDFNRKMFSGISVLSFSQTNVFIDCEYVSQIFPNLKLISSRASNYLEFFGYSNVLNYSKAPKLEKLIKVDISRNPWCTNKTDTEKYSEEIFQYKCQNSADLLTVSKEIFWTSVRHRRSCLNVVVKSDKNTNVSTLPEKCKAEYAPIIYNAAFFDFIDGKDVLVSLTVDDMQFLVFYWEYSGGKFELLKTDSTPYEVKVIEKGKREFFYPGL